MTQTAKFKTGGMHCHSCSMLITMTVEDLDGVAHALSDYASGMTVVDYDDSVVGAESIREAIVEAGYEAELVS